MRIGYRNDFGLTFAAAHLEKRIHTESIPSFVRHEYASQESVRFHAPNLRPAIKELPWRMGGIFCSCRRGDRYCLVRVQIKAGLLRQDDPLREPFHFTPHDG